MSRSLSHPREELVRIPTGIQVLEGDLALLEAAPGLVIFAHGSGSSRFSPRNRVVAGALREAGLGTLLLDLLTPDEERVDARTGHLRFDVHLLAERLLQATDWLDDQPQTRESSVGYFGASTGAAAALLAATDGTDRVRAVVSRGGRPDLAGAALARVRAPTLLIVGSLDETVLELNQQALEQLTAAHKKRLEIVQGATHLFEEPGALEQVAQFAADWFNQHLNHKAS